MRTGTVRIVSYRRLMINPAIAETLARDHQRDLQAAAHRAHLARTARGSRTRRHRRIRTRAGWWLVHTGIRLALSEPTSSRHSPTFHAARAR